jgi:alkaline phosphatase D
VWENAAFQSPHANMPQLAVPTELMHGRRLADFDDCTANPVTFIHGVASGDPLPTQVMIWTRLTPGGAPASVEHTLRYKVYFKVALDKALTQVVIGGEVSTSVEVDYTIKLDLDPLSPATRYYFQFSACGAYSSIGETKTLPKYGSSVAKVSLATVSCAFYT